MTERERLARLIFASIYPTDEGFRWDFGGAQGSSARIRCYFAADTILADRLAPCPEDS